MISVLHLTRLGDRAGLDGDDLFREFMGVMEKVAESLI